MGFLIAGNNGQKNLPLYVEETKKGVSQEAEPKSISSHTCATSDWVTDQLTAKMDMAESTTENREEKNTEGGSVDSSLTALRKQASAWAGSVHGERKREEWRED